MKFRIAIASAIIAGCALGSIGRLATPVPAPAFSLTDINGNAVTLASYKKKVVLLNFWETRCRACKLEFPHLAELQEKYKDKGLAVIGLSVDKNIDAEKILAFVKQHKINYPVAMATMQIVKEYGGMRYLPTTFLIDREGKLQLMFVGLYTAEDIEKELTPFLTPPPPRTTPISKK